MLLAYFKSQGNQIKCSAYVHPAYTFNLFMDLLTNLNEGGKLR